MKLVLDTNVLVSAFLARGTCAELLEHCSVRHSLVSSEPLLTELREKLIEVCGATPAEARDAETLLRTRMAVAPPAALPQRICRDPDDDVVLATALAGMCDCIVTGDKDLLVLKSFRSVTILSPSEFWRYERQIHRAE